VVKVKDWRELGVGNLKFDSKVYQWRSWKASKKQIRSESPIQTLIFVSSCITIYNFLVNIFEYGQCKSHVNWVPHYIEMEKYMFSMIGPNSTTPGTSISCGETISY
jgi:hypothetical protein